MLDGQGDGINLGLIRELTRLAFEFGPFLFAILLLLFITARARRYYNAVCTRETPPATDGEMRTHRRIYYASWAVSFALVAVSTAWWVWGENVKIFRFAVFDLKDPEMLFTIDNSIYRKITPHENGIGKNYFFLVSSARSMSKDQPIPIRYINVEAEFEKVVMLEHEGINNQIYLLERQANNISFRPIGQLQARRSPVVRRAWAAEPTIQVPEAATSSVPTETARTQNPFGWSPSGWDTETSKYLYTKDPETNKKTLDNYYHTKTPLKTHEIYQLQEQLYLQYQMRKSAPTM